MATKTSGEPKSDNLPAKPKRTPQITPEMKARQWQPGVSGNPAGRPKNQSLRAKIRQALESDSGDGDGTSIGDKLVKTLLDMAIKGDRAACEYVIDQIEGRPVQATLNVEARPVELRSLSSIVEALRTRSGQAAALPAPAEPAPIDVEAIPVEPPKPKGGPRNTKV